MDSVDIANDYDEKLEDWYHSSDTSDDIPDLNMSADPLFQDQDRLPAPLQRDHFKEGLIYTMTKHSDRKYALLVLIIEAKLRTFSYQLFFSRDLLPVHIKKLERRQSAHIKTSGGLPLGAN